METMKLWMLLLLLLTLIHFSPSSSSSTNPAPLALQIADLIVPYPEDPPLRITVIDLLHQGLFDSTGSFGSGAGFSLDTTANTTSVYESDCTLAKKSGFTLYRLALKHGSGGGGDHHHHHHRGNPAVSSFSLKPTVIRVPFKCDAPYGFVSTHYGIAALGPEASALPRQISAAKGLPPTFAFCFPNVNVVKSGNGSLFFGARSPSSYPFKLPLLRIPMTITNQYSLRLTGVEMIKGTNNAPAKKKLSLTSNGGLSVTVSSSQAYISFPSNVYNYIYNEIINSLSQRGIPEYKFDLIPYPSSGCYNLTQADILASPKIKLIFSSKYAVVLDGSNYFILTGGLISCLRIYEQDSAILGTTAQQGRLVEFDLEKKTLGISEPLSKFNMSCALKFPSK